MPLSASKVHVGVTSYSESPKEQLTGDTHALLIFIRNRLRSSFVGLSKDPGHLWSPLRTDPRGQPRAEAEESAQLQAA